MSWVSVLILSKLKTRMIDWEQTSRGGQRIGNSICGKVREMSKAVSDPFTMTGKEYQEA